MKNTAIGITLLCLWATTAVSQVIYDIDFELPAHRAGNLVSTGETPEYVSEIRFGSPKIGNGYGNNISQVLILDLEGNPGPYYYDQIALKPNLTTPSILKIHFELETGSLIGSSSSFSMLMDFPATRAVRFRDDGSIVMMNPNSTSTEYLFSPLSAYSAGESVSVDVHVDFTSDAWDIYINGHLVGGSSLLGAQNLNTIRFSSGYVNTQYWIPPGPVSVAIDNIVVQNIPEPSSYVAWAALFAAGFALFRRNRRGLTNC